MGDYYNEDNMNGNSDDEDDLFGFNNPDASDDDMDPNVDVWDDNEPELVTGYNQLEQLNLGNVELGTAFIGGKFANVERMIANQNLSKEVLYLQKLAIELNKYFSINQIQIYIEDIKKVPYYWLKNTSAISATLNLLNDLNDLPLTKEQLKEYSIKYDINKEDLLRYYTLLSKYL